LNRLTAIFKYNSLDKSSDPSTRSLWEIQRGKSSLGFTDLSFISV
jgi:hypothetical protein